VDGPKDEQVEEKAEDAVPTVDSQTGTEVSAMGPASSSQADLQRLALQKLKARLKREAPP